MKCPLCGDVLRETDPECRRCAALARRGVSPRRARTERRLTLLLTLLLVAGLLGLAAVAAHRHRMAAQARQQRQDARQAQFDTEAEDAPADDAPAARRDAQGDQSTDP